MLLWNNPYSCCEDASLPRYLQGWLNKEMNGQQLGKTSRKREKGRGDEWRQEGDTREHGEEAGGAG